jgi:hypothetical protein
MATLSFGWASNWILACSSAFSLLEARDYLVRATTVVKDAETKRKPVEKTSNVSGQIAVKLATIEAWLQEPGRQPFPCSLRQTWPSHGLPSAEIRLSPRTRRLFDDYIQMRFYI